MIGKRAAYTLQPALQQTQAQPKSKVLESKDKSDGILRCTCMCCKISLTSATKLMRKMLGLNAFNASQPVLQLKASQHCSKHLPSSIVRCSCRHAFPISFKI